MARTNIIGGFFSQADKQILEIIEDHAHKRSLVFPNGVAPITLTTTNSAWSDFSNMITEVCSAGDCSDLFGPLGQTFDIHWAVISDISANGNFEMKIYAGAVGSEEEISHIAFSRNAVQSQEGSQKVNAPRVVFNERISAAIQSDAAAALTVGVKFMGHAY